MCSSSASLGDLRKGMERFAATFEPGVYSAADASVLVQHAARIEKMAATVKALAAKRVADTEIWRRGGDRTAAHHLAKVAGTSVGEAKDALDTAARLAELPGLDRAAREGRVSSRQAAAIAGAASEDPSKEAALLDLAESGSLRELQEECQRVKAAASDADANYERIHRERSLRNWTDNGGAAHLHATGTVDAIAAMVAAIDEVCERRFQAGRVAGEREPRQAYAFDALHEMVCPPADAETRRGRRAPRPKVIARIDWDALIRGFPIDGETCDIAGVGPVPVFVVRAMIESGDAFLAAIVTRGVDVVNVAHLKRSPTEFQRTALQWLSPECTVLGCSTTARLEIDHTADWAKTKITLLRLLEHFCDHHHDLKTFKGWALTAGTGKRPLVPPDDPRHPDAAKDPPQVA